MRFRFILGVSLKQLWNNLKSTLVVLLSLTVCITSIFLMAEAMLYSNTFLQNLDQNRRTYSVSQGLNYDIYENTYTLYNEVMYGDSLPEIIDIYGIIANPILSENVEEYIAPAIYLDDDPRYTVELDLIEGRSFTAEELAAGSNVIIISNQVNYWRGDNEYHVGDTVTINDIPYEIIGIDNFNSYITEQNVLDNHNFYIYFDIIEFAEQLTSTDRQVFMDLFATVGNTPSSWYEQNVTDFAIHVATYVALIALVSYCAFSIIAQLFTFMVKSREYEYNIYKVLGIKRSLLSALYFTPVLLVFFASSICGVLLYRYSEPWQKEIGMGDVLSFELCAVCFAIIGIVLLIAVLPNYRKLYRRSAVETR